MQEEPLGIYSGALIFERGNVMENSIESKVAQREFLVNKAKALIRAGYSYEKITKELNIPESSYRKIREEIENET